MLTRRVRPLLAALLVTACGEKSPSSPPAAPPPPAPTVAVSDAALTRLATARGHLSRDPFATLGAHTDLSWRHGDLLVSPLTGALTVIAEDLRLPLGATDLVLVRAYRPAPSKADPRAHAWDDAFGLGPASPRCALGAACDPDGRVLAFVEDGRAFAVTRDGELTRITTGAEPFVEFAREAMRARGPAATPAAWPIEVRYRRDAAGRLLSVERAGMTTNHTYDDAGRLTRIAHGDAVTRIAWDALGRVTALDGPAELATRLAWSAPTAELAAAVSISDALGQSTRVTWSTPRADGTREVTAGDGARATRWVFDRDGRLLSHLGAGLHTRYSYDPHGRLAAVIHADGLTQTLERTAAGHLAAVVEAERRLDFTLSPDAHHLLALGTSERDRETFTWSSTSPPRLIRITHASGRHEAFTHDALGRVVRYETDAGLADALAYDPATGFLAAVTDERGDTRKPTYDAAGHLVALTHPDGATETWTRDPAGRALSHTAPDGAVTRFTYDPLGRLVALAHPAGEVRWRLDALGRPLAEETPFGTARYRWQGPDLVAVALSDGRTLAREHDAFGRLVVERWSDGREHRLTWAAPTDGGRLATFTIAGVLERRFTWDALGRPARLEERGPAPAPARDLRLSHGPDGAIAITEALTGASWTHRRLAPGVVVLTSAATASGAVESYTYDARGRLVAKTSSLGPSHTTSHDALGRPIAVAMTGAEPLRITWNAAGQLAALGPEHGPARSFAYDAARRLVAVAEGDARWALSWDGRDLVALVDPAGRRTTFSYDDAHRLAARTSPATGTTAFAHDDAGRLVSQRHADGRLETFAYDARGRLAQRSVDGVALRTVTFDADDRLVADSTPEHGTRVSWDATASTRTSTDTRGHRTTRTRDPAGRTTSLALAPHPPIRYHWRADGLLTRVSGPAGFTLQLEHDAFGRRTALRLPAATLTQRHDAARRLVALELVGPAGPTWSAHFTYDTAGRLATLSSAGRTLAYEYDARGRLAAFVAPDATRHGFGYDPAGALTAKGASPIALDAAGRPAQERRYDAAGRAVSLPGGWSVRYDPAGRLAAAERADTRIAYTYDGAGRLVSRRDGERITHELVRDGDALLRLVTPDAELAAVPGEHAGERFGYVDASGAARYLVQGPDGTTLAVVDGAGQVLASHLFEPFGEPLLADGAAPDPLAARGHFRDPATGLVHHAHRWYDPRVGAFLAPDPFAGDLLDPATLERYSYLSGDPVNHLDPLGAQAYEWGPGTCLEAVCKLFRSGGIDAVRTTRVIDDAYTYMGAIEKNGWTYDIWSKRVPGTDKVLTLFHDLGERAEGPFAGAGPYQSVVLDPDGPRQLQPAASTLQPVAETQRPGLVSRVGSSIRGAYEQAKIGVQLYGKEVTTTVAGLGGLSGTLGTSVGTLAALPGGGLIIAGAVAVAGAIGYGLGSVVNLIPGVAEGAQAVIGKFLGYDKDQLIANLEAEREHEGERAKELRQKEIEKNIARDTMPSPLEPGVAGGTIDLGAAGAPVASDPDRDRPPPSDERAPDATSGEDDEDDEASDEEGDDDEREQDEVGDDDVPAAPGDSEILKRVPARQVSFSFSHDEDASAGEFRNIVTCTETFSFWNVGALVPGYGTATWRSSCVASLNQSRMDTTEVGTFSGGPNGVLTFSGEGGTLSFKVVGGTTVRAGPFGQKALPAAAFADWPADL